MRQIHVGYSMTYLLNILQHIFHIFDFRSYQEGIISNENSVKYVTHLPKIIFRGLYRRQHWELEVFHGYRKNGELSQISDERKGKNRQ